jgi:hypothetical protein
MTIWYILSAFGIFFPVLVFWTKKNLAALTNGRSFTPMGDRVSCSSNRLLFDIMQLCLHDVLWRCGAMAIASLLETEDPGSNPARV